MNANGVTEDRNRVWSMVGGEGSQAKVTKTASETPRSVDQWLRSRLEWSQNPALYMDNSYPFVCLPYIRSYGKEWKDT